MITSSFYKDRPAVVLSANGLSAVFLPEDGGKLASLRTDAQGEFLAQAPGEAYRPLGLDTSYVQAECSAFDDMFPTIDPCTIGGMTYLDHGEICRRPHSAEITEDAASFRCDLPALNIFWTKAARIEGGSLVIRYRIENRNGFDFPYVWAGHMMLAGEEGAYIVCEFPADAEKKFMFGCPPDAARAHVLPKKGACREYKYYFTSPSAPVRCGAVYPKSGRQLRVEFDGEAVRYLGVWMNPGDLNGMYNLALEPCTALYDDPIRAKQAQASSSIPAGGCAEFTMKITMGPIEKE